MSYVSFNECIVSRNHWLNFIPMVAVVGTLLNHGSMKNLSRAVAVSAQMEGDRKRV